MSNDTKPALTEKARYDVLIPDAYQTNEGEKVNWIRAGVAFPHADGKGFQIELKALPTGGKLVMKLHEPRSE